MGGGSIKEFDLVYLISNQISNQYIQRSQVVYVHTRFVDIVVRKRVADDILAQMGEAYYVQGKTVHIIKPGVLPQPVAR